MTVDLGGRRPYAELIADRRGLLEAPHYAEQVMAIVATMVMAFRAGRKVLWCGNGGSAADAQHLAAEFSGRFLRERGGLNSEALSVNTSTLTAIANDFGYDYVFARQVEAFAQRGRRRGRDHHQRPLAQHRAGIGPSGKRSGATTVAFTGNGGGPVADVADLVLLGPHGYSAIVQEVHIAMGHIICDLVEQELLFP